jgi:trypsin
MVRYWSRVLSLLLLAPALAVPAHAQSLAYCDDRPAAKAKIIGGSPAANKDWPWFAALRLTNAAKKTTTAACGGAMIARDWVLTAAHCLADLDPGTFLSKGGGKLDVVVGLDDLRDVTEARVYAVAEIKIPREYNDANRRFQEIVSGKVRAAPGELMEPAKRVGFDIGLVRLARPWSGRTVALSLLPMTDPPASVAVRVAGFGLVKPELGWTGNQTRSYKDGLGYTLTAGCARLMQVSMPVVETNACRKRYTRTDAAPVINEGQICAGYKLPGKDSCKGDSGSPLVAIDANGESYQIGLVSWGLQNCGGEPEPYGIYTRISKHTQWINGLIGPVQTVDAEAVRKSAEASEQHLLLRNAIDEMEANLPQSGNRLRVLNAAQGPLRVRLGEIYKFEVRSEVAGRLVMIDVDAEGKVTQILPNSYVQSESLLRIAAGETLAVPTRPRFPFEGFKAVPPLGEGKVVMMVLPDDVPIELTFNAEVAEQKSKGFVPVVRPVPYLMNTLAQVRSFASATSGPAVGDRQSGGKNWAFTVMPYVIEP